MKPVFAALSLLTAIPAAPAQGMERIIVTANRIEAEDMRSAPAVYRQIPADFVLVAVTYQSATRDTGERAREPVTMFDPLKAKATFWIDPQAGDVAALRTDWRRTFDLFWGLHIMDWTNRETI